MAEPLVIWNVADGVARITLNDPASLNALTIEMVEIMLAALDEAQLKARVIVLTGAGRAFCSGANQAGGAYKDTGAPMPIVSHFNPLMLKIRTLSIPMIVAVRGAAAGYGASLALAGDLVIAAQSSFFLQAFRNLGMVPDGGAAATLVRSVGRIRAVELMLLAERLTAAKAFEWGLVTRVVPDAELDATVDALAKQLADGPTVALGMIRQMAWSAAETSFEDELSLEAQNQRTACETADYLEGVAAFLAKRPAKFSGR